MAGEALPVVIEMMTPEEIDDVFHANKKRAANFSKFLQVMNTKQVTDAWRIQIAKPARDSGLDPDAYAKSMKYNWNEAAANRTQWEVVDDDEVEADGEDADGNPIFRTVDKHEPVKLEDGVYRAERKAPVKLNWKTKSHAEKVEVVDPNNPNRKGEKIVTVIDSFQVMVIESVVRHRAPRAPREDVNVEALDETTRKAMETSTSVTLPDGRIARKARTGKWTTTKLAEPATDGTANGVAHTDDVPPPETPAAPAETTPEPARTGRRR